MHLATILSSSIIPVISDQNLAALDRHKGPKVILGCGGGVAERVKQIARGRIKQVGLSDIHPRRVIPAVADEDIVTTNGN